MFLRIWLFSMTLLEWHCFVRLVILDCELISSKAWDALVKDESFQREFPLFLSDAPGHYQIMYTVT